MAKFIQMWHPELDDSVVTVDERAFEQVHSLNGWVRWEDPEEIPVPIYDDDELPEISFDEVSEEDPT